MPAAPAVASAVVAAVFPATLALADLPTPTPPPARVRPPPTGALSAPAAPVAPAREPPACGWFESSFALRQGLQVNELPDSDGTLAALWFAAARGSRQRAGGAL